MSSRDRSRAGSNSSSGSSSRDMKRDRETGEANAVLLAALLMREIYAGMWENAFFLADEANAVRTRLTNLGRNMANAILPHAPPRTPQQLIRPNPEHFNLRFITHPAQNILLRSSIRILFQQRRDLTPDAEIIFLRGYDDAESTAWDYMSGREAVYQVKG
ncbi:hypothetical protein IFR05_016305 [Cadophora sp. M221]|nr:hypothetical protein IFR05_016305 [Cadophora sp. M221]